MEIRFSIALAAILVVPAVAQVPQDIKELLKAYDETTRSLEIKLHDATEKIEALEKELASAQTARKLAEGQIAGSNAQLRDRLITMLERFAQEDREIARSLMEKKGKVSIPPSPQAGTGGTEQLGSPGQSAGQNTAQSAGQNTAQSSGQNTAQNPAQNPGQSPLIRDLIRDINQRIRERELLIRALLMDRLGAAGQDILETRSSH